MRLGAWARPGQVHGEGVVEVSGLVGVQQVGCLLEKRIRAVPDALH